jgi:hypothetical protein
MSKKLIFSGLLICLLVFVAVFAFAQNSPNVRWEYKVMATSDASVQAFNSLGVDGWEIVTFGVVGKFNNFVFKRRLP